MADDTPPAETPITVETPVAVVPEIKDSHSYKDAMATLLQPVAKPDPASVELEADADLALLTAQVDRKQGQPVEKMNTDGLPDDIWEAGFEDRQANKPVVEEKPVVTPEAVVETPAVVDPHEAMVNAIRAADPKITLKAAMKAADAALGEAAPTTEETEQAPAVPAVEALTSELEQVEGDQMDAAEEAWAEAVSNLAPAEEQKAARDAIKALKDRAKAIKAQIPQAQEAATAQYDKLTADMAAHAVQSKVAFPLLNDPASPFVGRCNAIHDAYEKANPNHPMLSNPRKAILIAAEAMAENPAEYQKELQAYQQKKGTASPAPKTAPVSPAHMTAPIASPSTRTTTYDANPIGREIDTIKSDEEYTAMMRRLTAKR